MNKTIRGTVVKRLDASSAGGWYQRYNYILIDDNTSKEYILSNNKNTQDPAMDRLVGQDLAITGREKNGLLEIHSITN